MAKALTTLLPAPDKIQALSNRLPEAISLLLIIACAYALSTITWTILDTNDNEAISQPVNPTSSPVQNNNNNQAFRQLTSAQLFGTASVAAPVKTKVTPKTQLNLTLKGVLAADSTNGASAIIAQGKRGAEEIFGINEKISSGVSIKEIHPDHVVLDRKGQLERLELIQDKDIGSLVPEQSRQALSPSSSAAASLSSIRKDIMKNPTSFAEYALPVVVRENGKQIGYRLQAQKKGDLLQQMGLQPDDIITSVNGISLNNPQNGIGALRKLSNEDNINIMVKRNGTEVPLNIQLQ